MPFGAIWSLLQLSHSTVVTSKQHRQYVMRAWLCFNKTLVIETGIVANSCSKYFTY